MGILKRFKDIMSANINAVLDKAENPEKMIDQYLRDLKNDLSKVKAETASVMADEAKARRDLEQNEKEIEKMTAYAEKALLSGNEADAKIFLSKKVTLEKKRETLEAAFTNAVDNAEHMKEMHAKLSRDIDELEKRKQEIKNKMALAKSQEKLNKVGGSYNAAEGTLSAFERMEEKANRMIDEANAMAELDKKPERDDAEKLMDKYSGDYETDMSVDMELEAMKAKLGM